MIKIAFGLRLDKKFGLKELNKNSIILSIEPDIFRPEPDLTTKYEIIRAVETSPMIYSRRIWKKIILSLLYKQSWKMFVGKIYFKSPDRISTTVNSRDLP